MKSVDELEIVYSVIGALFTALAGSASWIMRKNSQRIDHLEARVRKTEKDLVTDTQVRQLVEDVCRPIKESNEEIKKDVKEILHVIINHNFPGGK